MFSQSTCAMSWQAKVVPCIECAQGPVIQLQKYAW